MLDITRENLELVLESIKIINQRFLIIAEPKNFIDTSEGLTVLDSIAMRLQYIGECLKRIDKNDKVFFDQHPQVEWSKIINLRDFISHHYESLNYEIVFGICKRNLPDLETKIQKLLYDAR